MRGLLLALIEEHPEMATRLFLTAFERIPGKFVKFSDVEKFFLHFVDYDYLLTHDRLVKVTADDVEKKILDVFRKEVENNFNEFNHFLTSPKVLTYQIHCRLENCVTSIDTTCEEEYMETCEYIIKIRKRMFSALGFTIDRICAVFPQAPD